MRVKIGDTWYDSTQEPICVQLSEEEQKDIANMDRAVATKGKYASFPDDYGSPDEMREWMKDP